MLSEYEVKFMVDMCGRRETAEKGGENLRVYQGKESMTASQSTPPGAATGMKGARGRNGCLSWL